MSKNTVEIQNYDAELDALVEKAAKGEEVLITRDGEPVAQIVPLEPGKPRGFGSGRASDFDEPREAFDENGERNTEAGAWEHTGQTDRLTLLRAGRGMWRDRDDLPDPDALRREADERLRRLIGDE